MPSNLDIALQARLTPIADISDELDLCGQYKAKVSLEAITRLEDRPN